MSDRWRVVLGAFLGFSWFGALADVVPGGRLFWVLLELFVVLPLCVWLGVYLALTHDIAGRRTREHYWCGCIRWLEVERCERHADLEIDDDVPHQTRSRPRRKRQPRTPEKQAVPASPSIGDVETPGLTLHHPPQSGRGSL